MSGRASVASGLRVFGLASLLTGIVAGGIAVALGLEESLLGPLEDVLPRSAPPAFDRTEAGRIGFTFTTDCRSVPVPPFELLAPILVPFLLGMALPPGRPVTLRLHD